MLPYFREQDIFSMPRFEPFLNGRAEWTSVGRKIFSFRDKCGLPVIITRLLSGCCFIHGHRLLHTHTERVTAGQTCMREVCKD